MTALVLYFLKLGTFGFGGPIALAGYMQRNLVEERHWFSEQEFLDGLALAQLSPGPLAAQLAMYLGLLRGGYTGAVLIGGAFILPSFVMVLALSFAYVRYGGLWMQSAFYGIGAAVIAIIARSAVKLVKSAVRKDRLLWAIFLTLLISTAVTEREIVWLFVGGGLVALAIKGDWRKWLPKSQALFVVWPALGSDSQFLTILGFFAKASLFVFGSGLAIVPFLHGGVVQEHHWLTERQFLDAVAVAMITPGPVVITVAFIGYVVGGASGAIAAALGVFVPILLIVLLLGPHFQRISARPELKAFVAGVTAAATGAIAGAVIVLARRSIVDVWTAAIAALTFLILLKWKVPEPVLIVAAGIIGFAVQSV
ncbi:MAG TPA: chromate efflux transporter [Candidatus Angelobacter sp.]